MGIRTYLLTIPILFVFTLHAAEITNYPQAIDMAGKQRALSFKMAMYKAMLESNLNYKNPADRLKKTQHSFEEAQKSLKTFVKDKNILKALSKVDSDYTEMKKILSSDISENEIDKLLNTTLRLKKDANSVVSLLVKKSGIKSSEKIDYAGYLRALSQKTALYYIIHSWTGEESKTGKEIHKELHKTINEMGNIIKKLSSYSDNTRDEKKLIEKLNKDHLYFKIMMDSEISTPVMVLKKSDRIFANADKLVKLYKQTDK